MQTYRTTTVSKIQCDLCYRNVETHGTTTQEGNSGLYEVGKYEETFRYPEVGASDYPYFFRVQMVPEGAGFAPLIMQVCDRCVSGFLKTGYGAPTTEPRDWFDNVIDQLRPQSGDRPELADSSESEVHGAEVASDDSSERDPDPL